jgi:tRNA(Arg) A34 adenosine deaminase TadA
MCAAAMVHARIRRCIYAASDPKAGVVDSQQKFFEQPWLNHRVAVSSGECAEEAGTLLRNFFRARR